MKQPNNNGFDFTGFRSDRESPIGIRNTNHISLTNPKETDDPREDNDLDILDIFSNSFKSNRSKSGNQPSWRLG